MIFTARLRHSRFLRFAVVGGAGFLVNEAALWLAIRVLGVDPYAGGLLSFFVAVTFTWWGNRNLTFPEHAAKRARSIASEWLSFVAANGIGFVVNYGVYAMLIAIAHSPLNNAYVALGLGTLAGLMFNFLLSSRYVFRPPRQT